MNKQQMHKTKATILYALRHRKSARYTDLMRPSGMDSDVFKFHIRSLVEAGYVKKLKTGDYELTPPGKEFANSLNETGREVLKQPKLSIILIAQNPDSKNEYLFQQRHRHPFYEFWSCIGGKVQWGESAEEAAARELTKQTGLSANFIVRSIYRSRDYSLADDLLEDKLFIVLEASNVSGKLIRDGRSGMNVWLTVAQLKQKEKFFNSGPEIIAMLSEGTTYISQKNIYTEQEY